MRRGGTKSTDGERRTRLCLSERLRLTMGVLVYDLDLLRSADDEATDDLASGDDVTITEIARVLFEVHLSGVRDRQELLGTASDRSTDA